MKCGSSVVQQIPEGDTRRRAVCQQCAYIHYENPRIVSGALPVYQDQVLLCKRAIEPRKGYWTLPGGFMELGETMAEAAARETLEEACAQVHIQQLYTLFDVVHAEQVSVFFLADLKEPVFAPGIESEEVRLFSESQIPWEDLAFSTIEETLRRYFQDRVSGHFPTYQLFTPPPIATHPASPSEQ